MKLKVRDLMKTLNMIDDNFDIYIDGNEIAVIDVNGFRQSVNLISKQTIATECVVVNPVKYLHAYIS